MAQYEDPRISVPSKQFFDIGSFENQSGDYNTIANKSNRNPKFAWPKPYFRQINGSVVELQRGYIRLLTPNKVPTPQGIPRCFFQFNPDSISRGITARNDVQLWINQDPGQLGQPMYGDQNFSFELLFNREAEVFGNTGSPRSFNGAVDPEFIEYGSVNGGVSDIQASDVKQVGVLADLSMLDSIIGIGLSAQIMDFQVKQYNARQEFISRQNVDANGDSSKTEDDAILTAEKAALFTSSNIGNKAFLLPNPIRVIFSRLFMLDGYIQSVQVTFNKFSPSMIPTQCSVAIQMQALYFGFAQESSFLTKVLDNQTASGGVSKDVQIRDLQELSTYLIASVSHKNGGNERIEDFGIATPTANKISFNFLMSNPYYVWKERTKVDVTFEPYLKYAIYDGTTLLFEAYTSGINLNTSVENEYGHQILGVDFYPIRPSTMKNGTQTLNSGGSFRYVASLHIDMRVASQFIPARQNIGFDIEGLEIDEGFSFGIKIPGGPGFIVPFDPSSIPIN